MEMKRPLKAVAYVCIVLGACLALVTLGHVWLLSRIGSFLEFEDPLEPAAAVVILFGHLPFRELEAASLYHEGWAPKIMLTRKKPQEEQETLKEIGFNPERRWEFSRKVLLRLGVPSSAILIAQEEANSTLEEVGVVARAFQLETAPIILVTSKVHGRRVRLIWNHVTQNRVRAIVRLARGDPFDSTRWWKKTRWALALVREYLGLLNLWAGFPLPS